MYDNDGIDDLWILSLLNAKVIGQVSFACVIQTMVRLTCVHHM